MILILAAISCNRISPGRSKRDSSAPSTRPKRWLTIPLSMKVPARRSVRNKKARGSMSHVSILLIAGMFFAASAWAQQSTARLLGTVKDPTGAVVAGATVTARNLETGLDRKAVTNDAGDYSIPLLSIVHYTVYTHASGFKTTTITELTRHGNQ